MLVEKQALPAAPGIDVFMLTVQIGPPAIGWRTLASCRPGQAKRQGPSVQPSRCAEAPLPDDESGPGWHTQALEHTLTFHFEAEWIEVHAMRRLPIHWP